MPLATTFTTCATRALIQCVGGLRQDADTISQFSFLIVIVRYFGMIFLLTRGKGSFGSISSHRSASAPSALLVLVRSRRRTETPAPPAFDLPTKSSPLSRVRSLSFRYPPFPCPPP